MARPEGSLDLKALQAINPMFVCAPIAAMTAMACGAMLAIIQGETGGIGVFNETDSSGEGTTNATDSEIEGGTRQVKEWDHRSECPVLQGPHDWDQRAYYNTRQDVDGGMVYLSTYAVRYTICTACGWYFYPY